MNDILFLLYIFSGQIIVFIFLFLVVLSVRGERQWWRSNPKFVYKIVWFSRSKETFHLVTCNIGPIHTSMDVMFNDEMSLAWYWERFLVESLVLSYFPGKYNQYLQLRQKYLQSTTSNIYIYAHTHTSLKATDLEWDDLQTWVENQRHTDIHIFCIRCV